MPHPWHDITVGEDAPGIVTGIIEIPEGSRAKYELDKDSGLLKLDRVLFSSMHYPANYGFIPQTYCEDNDPLDILVLSQIKIQPLCLVQSKVIGVMRMRDEDEADDKIIAVAAGDKSVSHINDISEMPDHWIIQLRNFFEDYKKLENKTVVIDKFQDRSTAVQIVKESMQMYQDKFGKK